MAKLVDLRALRVRLVRNAEGRAAGGCLLEAHHYLV